ncbi:hypothetical protein [Crenobacter luteus]|uniref:Transmembrane protein n=1 Tax=Crenobacter luteus TaxID=1452487 RepID=A0A165FHI8_9NEIS|nr:hypothetical protein [Crenobacter luteus]KZE33295.1 hypothetical protein AVW16_09030 [Crenobacter luteus]
MSLRNLARLKLLLLALFCASPVLGSWVAYQARLPAPGKTVGLLLPTQPFAVAGAPAWPKGQWVLAVVAGVSCDARCEERLFAARQWHRAQGEAAARMRRVLVGEPGGPALEGVRRVAGGAAAAALEGGVYLVDPLGNQVMFYRDGVAPTAAIREVARLLKTNNGLG